MNFRKKANLLMIFISALLLFGCAPPYVGPPGTPNDNATLETKGCSFDWGTQCCSLTGLDSAPKQSFNSQIMVTPGKHVLRIYCSDPSWMVDWKVTMDLEAGVKYAIEVNKEGVRSAPQILTR